MVIEVTNLDKLKDTLEVIFLITGIFAMGSIGLFFGLVII